MSERGIARATIDREGRLADGDEPLLALNARSGGALGRSLAVPALAGLARVTQRLGVPVSRSLRVADDEGDLELWVRAAPAADGVELAVSGWRPRGAWRPPLGLVPPPVIAHTGWGWEVDTALRLVRVPGDHEALLGASLTQLFRIDEAPDGDLPLLGALAARAGFRDQPARLRATGEVMLLAGEPRRDALGGFAGYVGIAEPAEAATAASAPLTELFADRLDQALRGSVTRIVANADSIHAAIEGPLGPDYVDYAADIASAGRHLLGLIEDLADLQAIERADFRVAAEPLDLADVARRAAGLLAVRAADSGVTIARPDSGEALSATAEFRRTLQILVNLIGNAIRYSPPGGTVGVEVRRDETTALAIVADQGLGIAAADHARIFDKFERLDPSEPGGNGLGLYIARRLARAMGGDLTVDSVPGAGARFTLALPLDQG